MKAADTGDRNPRLEAAAIALYLDRYAEMLKAELVLLNAAAAMDACRKDAGIVATALKIAGALKEEK